MLLKVSFGSFFFKIGALEPNAYWFRVIIRHSLINQPMIYLAKNSEKTGKEMSTKTADT